MNEHSCEFYEQLLLQQATEPIDAQEKIQLDQHLRACPGCTAFQQTLVAVEQAADFEHDVMWTPGKHVRTRLQQVFYAKRQKVGRRLFRVRFQQFLSYRIPVYQAAFGVALILIILLISRHFPKAQPPVPSKSIQIPSEQNYRDDELQQLQSIQKQTGGRNAWEDSALTRFVISL